MTSDDGLTREGFERLREQLFAPPGSRPPGPVLMGAATHRWLEAEGMLERVARIAGPDMTVSMSMARMLVEQIRAGVYDSLLRATDNPTPEGRP